MMGQTLATAEHLAQHLREMQEPLTHAWVERLRADHHIRHANPLEEHRLLDHVPVVYREVCDAIAAGRRAPDPEIALARAARLHGYYRWAQGYELEELMRELDLLRRTVVEAAAAFCQQAQCDPQVLVDTTQIVEDLFAEVTLNSVRQHMHQQRLQVQASLDERRRAERALQAADQRKDQFLAMLAHELRNPLAPIRSAVTILKSLQTSLPEAAGQAATIIDRQSQQLNRLVDDLLDVARLTSGRIVLKRVDAELKSVLHQALEQTRPLIDARRHVLEVSLCEGPVYVDGDPDRLTQIFGNLLVNAAKYTDPGGHLRLALSVVAGQAVVVVSDDGIGIAPEVLPHVFEIFTQSPRALDRAKGGLGIGLTLVKRIVELHGGSVAASSEGEQRGSQFTIRLPVVEPVPRVVLPSLAKSIGPQPPPRRILIVDDNLDAAATLMTLLEMIGHQVRMTADGIGAMAEARRFRPHMILLDIGLPGINGLEVCRRLRQEKDMEDVVIAAVTGYGQPQDRQRTREAGFDFHLVKPVIFEDLLKLIALDSRTHS